MDCKAIINEVRLVAKDSELEQIRTRLCNMEQDRQLEFLTILPQVALDAFVKLAIIGANYILEEKKASSNN